MSRWKLSRKKNLEYSAREPTGTPLYRLVYNYRDDFERSWESLFEHKYGALRDEVLKSLDAYLNCGILANGAARVVCPKCNHSMLVAYSCKRRCLCPSCDAKRAVIFAENLVENVLLPYPQRHVVFTIPKRLRCYFKFDRSLLSHLYTAAWESWSEYTAEVVGHGSRTGMVAALHTAGDLLSFHPHVHTMALSGAIDDAGTFHELPLNIDTARICELFRDEVFAALLGEELLDEETIASMKSWSNSGFSVFASDPIEPKDLERLLFVARYLKRCPVSNERMLIDETDGNNPRVLYTSYKDGAAVSTREFSPLEFLAELSQHIPDTFEQTTRFFGLYSARTRGAQREAQEDSTTTIELEQRDKASRKWAACMKKVFEVDPLVCPKCGETMQIKAFLHDPKEIERICKNVGRTPWRAPPPMHKIPLAA